MSTPIHPRTQQRTHPPRRPHTGPTPSRPAPAAPFRWSSQRQLARSARPALAAAPGGDILRPDLPDPGPWAAVLARAIVEVVTGARQAPQLRRWLLPDLYAALVGVHLTPCARGTTPIHVRTCTIDARHTEAAVIVATATRTFALALRLEEYRGRWMTTALELA